MKIVLTEMSQDHFCYQGHCI